MDHTPTPWKAELSEQDTLEIYGKDGQCIATIRHSDGNREETGAFIVRACNSHDALVQRLEHAVYVLRSYAEGGLLSEGESEKLHAEADNAEAALKLAKGDA